MRHGSKIISTVTSTASRPQWQLPFYSELTKSESVLVKECHQRPVYSIDRLLQESRYTPFGLPPYQPDLNPGELILNMVK